VDGFWATKSEGVALVVRAVSFQDFQPVVWSWSTQRQTNRQLTDGQCLRRSNCLSPHQKKN